jgi:predicted NBD/HSP70 family sugar kinase/biotin operon repressor
MDAREAGVDTTLVRHWNRTTVLQALREASPTTVSMIANRTGLSRQTVTTVLDGLTVEGLAVESEPDPGATGRPARRFSFLPDAGTVVGISIAPDHIQGLATDLDGTELARDRIEVPPDLPAHERLAAARDLAHGCVPHRRQVWAAAAATSGIVDRHGRVVRATQLPGWTGVDLAGTVGSWFGSPGAAGNDGALAVLGEHWKGNAGFARDIVLMLTGHRTGQGMMLDGHLHLGHTGAAGELGKLLHDQAWDPSAALSAADRTAYDIFAAARAGDREALTLTEDIAERMAGGLSVLISVLDPELVVIAGDYAEAGDLLLDRLAGGLAMRCARVPQLTTSSLGQDVVALGAARLALDRVESGPSPLNPASLH